MSSYDDWHPENKGKAKDALNLKADPEKDKIQKLESQARMKAMLATQKEIAEKDRQLDTPKPEPKPKNLGLVHDAKAQARSDRNKSIYDRNLTKEQKQMKATLKKEKSKDKDRGE